MKTKVNRFKHLIYLWILIFCIDSIMILHHIAYDVPIDTLAIIMIISLLYISIMIIYALGTIIHFWIKTRNLLPDSKIQRGTEIRQNRETPSNI